MPQLHLVKTVANLESLKKQEEVADQTQIAPLPRKRKNHQLQIRKRIALVAAAHQARILALQKKKPKRSEKEPKEQLRKRKEYIKSIRKLLKDKISSNMLRNN